MGQAEPGGGLVQALGALGHGHGEDAERQGVMAAYQSVKAWLESQEQSSQMQVDQQGDAGPGDSSEPTLQGDSSVQDAIVLYAARLAYQLSSDRQPAGTCGLPLSAIASVAGSHLFDLFRDWPVVSAKLAPYFEQHLGLTVKQLEGAGNISEHQKLLVSMALLSKKYKDLFNKYMHSLPEHKPIVLKMGWLLYLVLKAKLLPKFPDLVSCMEVLVCVMNVLVSHLEPLPADMVAGPEGATNLLAIISDALKADRAHVQHLMLSVNAVFTQQLQSQSRHHAERQDQRAGVQLSCSYFPGLLSDAARMTVLTALLEREYRAHFQRHGEIDEVDMLYMDFARFASPRMTPSAIYRHNPFSQPPGHPDHVGLPRESPKTAAAHHKAVQLLGGPQAQAGQRLGPGSFVSSPLSGTAGLGVSPMAGGLPSGLHSPLAIAQLGATTNTPISAALGAAAWLRHVTALLQPEPSPLLLKYFAACVPNPGAAIARRVREMTDMVLPSDAQPASAFPMVQPSIAAYRREEAIKLYYHVLELVMASEERVATAAGHAQAPCYTTLLTSSKLHKGLMVCSLEVVMACYKMVSCPFPKVLEIIKLHAFDLIKIVQTYVRHMPGMPLELKRHLYLMEEKTVEQLAWQAGSSLYPLIITAMGNTGATSSCTTNATGTTTTGATTTATTSASASVTTTGVAAAPSSSQGGPTTTASAATTHPSTASAARTEAAPGSEDTASQAAASTAVPVAAAAPVAGAGTDGTAAQPATAPAAAGHGDAANAAAAAGSHGPAPSPSKRHASSTHSLMSPLKKARGSDSSAITTQAAPQLMEPLPAAVGRPPPPGVLSTLHPETAAALTWLHDFLRKVLKLAWFRLGFLCQSLHFVDQEAAVVRQKVYDTVEHALYMHTNLLYNRHLDQLLLSALYGYCKVQHLGTITFKEIIAQYRRQPQATQAVFRSVVLAQTNPGLQVQSRGDIIAYYNQAFVPLMKQYLLRGEAAAHPGLGLPPIPPSLPPRQSASPRFGTQGAGPGGASPRLFQAPGSGAASPVGSPCPQGRPPLPPQQCDVVAVNHSIKQTISGFFPALPRGNGGGGKNCLPLSHMSPKTQKQGAAVKPMHGPPPRWGAPGGKPPAAAGGLPCMPAAPCPEPQPIPPQQMPSGLATLLRALDTANGVHMADEEEEGGRESSQEEGTVRAPPQHSPLSGGHVTRAGRDAKVGEGAVCASSLSCAVERMRGGAGAAEGAAGVAGQQGSVSPDAASSDTRGALQVL